MNETKTQETPITPTETLNPGERYVLKKVAALEAYKREIKVFYIYIFAVLSLFIAMFLSASIAVGVVVLIFSLVAGLLGGATAKKEADRLNQTYGLNQATIFNIFKKS